MKKQLLILLVLAFFAGISAFGQALPGSTPRGVSCTGSPLTPIAGNSYDYTALGTPAGGNFTFWATKDQDFITTTAAGVTTTNIATRLTTPADLLATSANYGVPDPAATVSITWSDAILAGTDPATSPTFVATLYNGTACADNFRVWSIDPIKAFTVDVKNIEDATTTPLDYDDPEDQCMDVVRGATYNAGAMEYDFGTQILYFEVVAANFTVSWTPTFTVTNLHAVQTALVEWTYQNPTVTPWDAATVWNPATTTVTTNETNTANGVSIYVRVTITNANYEGNVPRNISLVVDGVNSVGDWDIENNTLTDPGPLCNAGSLNDGMDVATQTLNPRPELTPVAPVPFVAGDEQN